MPRGDPTKIVPNSARTPQKVKENTTKAGQASGEARRKKKERQNIFQAALDGKYTDNKTGEQVTGEEMLIRGIAVNLANPNGKHWLGTVKMIAESLGFTLSPEIKKKLNAEVKKLAADTSLTEEKIKYMQGGSAPDEIEDDDLTVALESVAQEMERENADK